MARTYLKGLPELKAKLVKLRGKTGDDIKPALARGAQSVVDLAKSLVRVDDGDLRDSIGWTFGSKPRYSQSLARAVVNDIAVTIFAGNSKVRYPHLVEFGAAPHIAGGIFEGAQHPGAPAQPFFFPAYRALKKQIRRELQKAIREAVRREVAS